MLLGYLLFVEVGCAIGRSNDELNNRRMFAYTMGFGGLVVWIGGYLSCGSA